MRAMSVVMLATCLFAGNVMAQRAPHTTTDAQVKQQVIKQSIANYSGACPCPYNVTRNGSMCGGRSAYSRAGGASPVCYAKDVTPAMVAEWRAQNGG